MKSPNTLTKTDRLAESARRLMLMSRVRRLGSAVSDITTEGDFRISVFAYDEEYPIVRASVDETGFCTELLGVQTAEMGTLYGGVSLEKIYGSRPVINVWARSEGQEGDNRIGLPAEKCTNGELILPEHLVVVGELTRRIRDFKKKK